MAGRRVPMDELEVIEALCCLVERAVAVIRDEQTKEALLRELDAATGAEDMTTVSGSDTGRSET